MSLKSLIKKSNALYRVADLVRRLPWPLLSGWMRLCHAICRVDGHTVYFSSFNGMLYNDNPRAVAEALHALSPQTRIVFRLNRRAMRDESVPDWIVRVPRFSLRALKAMATARVIVKNAGMLPWMRKFSDQYYIQLWHGDRGFKRIRLDRPRKDAIFRTEAGWLDLMVSGSRFGSGVYRSAFAYEGEILECGCPRNDLLLDPPPGIAARVRAELGVPEGARVLLYAPTFRRATSGGKQRAALSLEAVRARLERATGEKWVCVARSHELNRGLRSDAQLDASDWVETGELLLATDLLITDYSSIAGDFMLLDRPAVFFQPDRGAYDGERGLYFDPDKSPLLVAHTEAELLEILSRPIDAAANCRAVLDFFGACESGHAARSVAERIAAVLNGSWPSA